MNNLPPNTLTVEELISGNLELCSPPEVFLKIDDALKKPKTNASIIAEIIQHDPALTARLLRLSNSPIYGLGKQVISIEQAINLLGENNLKNLVLATTIISRFTHLMPHGSSKEYWSGSIQCALLAKQICQTQSPILNFTDHFICGLLHDIGLLVLFLRLPELTRAALLQNDASSMGICNIEHELFGFDHFQVGAELTESWGLPEIITNSIKHHENPLAAPQTMQRTTVIVSVAHQLSQMWNETEFEKIEGCLEQAESNFGIRIEDAEALWTTTKEQFEQSFKLFF